MASGSGGGKSARLAQRLWLATPVVALVALVATWGRDIGVVVVVVVAVLLAGAVLAAVHHAEVVAHRVGEPFGSLVLAVSVTVIEVSLIVALMLSGGDKAATLARDTVFAAVMITVGGIVGLSLLLGARRDTFARFNAEGSGGALATVAALAVLCLVLPSVTLGEPGPEFTPRLVRLSATSIPVMLSRHDCEIDSAFRTQHFMPAVPAGESGLSARRDAPPVVAGPATITDFDGKYPCLKKTLRRNQFPGPKLHTRPCPQRLTRRRRRRKC